MRMQYGPSRRLWSTVSTTMRIQTTVAAVIFAYERARVAFNWSVLEEAKAGTKPESRKLRNSITSNWLLREFQWHHGFLQRMQVGSTSVLPWVAVSSLSYKETAHPSGAPRTTWRALEGACSRRWIKLHL
jgi:hypothetical protein